MSAKTDSLPTMEELQAAEGPQQKREPVKYEIPNRPRVVRIDPNTNAELPPIMEHTPKPKPDKDEAQGGDDIPEKLRGKTQAELIEMYRNAESRLGSLSNEVGSLRKIVENVAQLKHQEDMGGESGHDELPVDITSDELLTNPAEAIRKVVTQTTKKETEPVRQTVEDLLAQNAINAFRAEFPNFEQDMADPAFQNWVQKSNYRMRLAAKASQQGDLDAAYELFGAWNEVKDSIKSQDGADSEGKPKGEAEQPRERPNADEARLMQGGGAALGQFDNRIFSTEEIINMRLNEPERYYDDRMQAVLRKAYAEGRVR